MKIYMNIFTSFYSDVSEMISSKPNIKYVLHIVHKVSRSHYELHLVLNMHFNEDLLWGK